MKFVSFVAILLLVIGALNWFLVGVFGIDLVARFFGDMTILSRVIYILVGLSGFYVLFNFKKHV